MVATSLATPAIADDFTNATFANCVASNLQQAFPDYKITLSERDTYSGGHELRVTATKGKGLFNKEKISLITGFEKNGLPYFSNLSSNLDGGESVTEYNQANSHVNASPDHRFFEIKAEIDAYGYSEEFQKAMRAVSDCSTLPNNVQTVEQQVVAILGPVQIKP
jgi:hypothetical protein